MTQKRPIIHQVEEILLDMKDTSELMVDLAYSSVFYNSQGIAREVHELEEEVGEELTRLQRLCLEAVRDEGLATEQAMVLMRVAQAAEVIANSALEIADVVLRDVELHPVLSAAIGASDSAVTKVNLAADSDFADRGLADLALETETGMRVLAVKRSGRWNTGVQGPFVLRADDLLVAVGPQEAVESFLIACDPAHDAE